MKGDPDKSAKDATSCAKDASSVPADEKYVKGDPDRSAKDATLSAKDASSGSQPQSNASGLWLLRCRPMMSRTRGSAAIR